MALTLGPSSNRGLLLPLPSPPETPTALPECCPNDDNTASDSQPDEPPTQSQLRRLENYPLYDSSGHTHPFSSLFTPTCLRKRRLLLIFIRNFFCGNCQQYLLTLSSQLPPSSLPSDVAVAIIGCGAPSLLPSYLELTHCPYPLYTDPSAQLYAKLGMKRSWSLGNRAPQYIQQSLLLGGLKSIAQGLKRLPAGDVTKAGEMDQNGGEFLFRRTADHGFWTDDWEVDWCHRMRNTRDHTEVGKLRNVLGMKELGASGPARKASMAEATTGTSKERHGRRWTKRSLSLITPNSSGDDMNTKAKDSEKEEMKAAKRHQSLQKQDHSHDQGHKRNKTLTKTLSQKSQIVIRTLSLNKRPGTAGSWAKDAETQKRSLTPAVALPDLPRGKPVQDESEQEVLVRQMPKGHGRKHSRSKSAAQILSLRVQTVRKKEAGNDDTMSESHVALVSVVSPGQMSFRSLTPQVGSPDGTPLLSGVKAAGRQEGTVR